MTLSECLATANLPRSYDDTYQSAAPSLKRLGIEAARETIMQQLTMIEAGFTVDNPLTVEGYRLAAEMIFEEYPYLTANEIQLIVKKAIKGEFGKDGHVYNRIDVSVIMVWVRKYYEERATIHDMLRQRDRKRDELEFSEWDPEVKRRAIEARDKILAKWRKDDDERRRMEVARELEAKEEADRLRREHEERQKLNQSIQDTDGDREEA